MTYQQEAQTWQEMEQTLQEMHELQAMQGETGTASPRTQAVVIRIQLMPSKGPIFGHPRKVWGATGTAQAPMTGRTIVPIKEVNTVTGEVSNGVVYAPEIGSQEFEFSFLGTNALSKAGGWLARQFTKLPQLAQRVKSIKALGGGKPCPGCEQQFAQQVSGAMPKKRLFNLQINRGDDGKMNTSLNYQGPRIKNLNLVGTGQGRDMNFNLWGQGAQGQNLDANFSQNNGNWNLGGQYQDPQGNYTNLSGQGRPGGQWDVNTDGNLAGNNFGMNAAADGNQYNGYGYLQGSGGGYGGAAFAGGPGQFQGQGAYISPNMNANANYQYQEMESSVLGEVFREIGI